MRNNVRDTKEQHRINERIRVPEVRLVGDNVEQGIYPTREALRIAEEKSWILWRFLPQLFHPYAE